MDVRTKITVSTFFLICLVTTFFSGEWDKWLQAIIFFLTFLLGFLVYRQVDFGSIPRLSLNVVLRSPFFYFAVLLLVMLASSFYSVSPYDSWSQVLLFLGYGIIFFGSFFFFSSWSLSSKFIRGLVFIGAIVSIIGLILFINQSSPRAGGLFFNANALSSFLILVLPLSLVMLAQHWQTKLRWLFGVSALLLTVTLMLTYSYTAWVAFLIPGYFLIRRYRKVFLNRKILIVVVLVIVVGIVALVGLRFQRTGDLNEAVLVYKTINYEQFISSFSQRLNFNQSAWEIFSDNPVLGTGLNTYQSMYPQYFHSVIEQPRYTHNYYLQTAAELGIFGALALVGFIYFFFAHAIRSIRREGKQGRKDILLALSLGIVGSAIHSLFDFGWQFPGVIILFWIEVGILLGLTSTAGQVEDGKRSLLGKCMRIGVPIILLLVLVRGGSVFMGAQAFDRASVAIENVEPNIAAAAYQQGLTFDPDPEYLYKTVGDQTHYRSLIDSFDPEGLVEQMATHLDNVPQSYIGHWTLGRLYFSQGQYEEAIASYQQAVRYNPVFRPDMYYDLAFTYFVQEEYQQAEDAIRSVLVHYPVGISTSNPNLPTQLGFLYLLLGDIYHKQTNDDLAQWHYEKALLINPGLDLAQQKLNELSQ